MNDVIGNLVVRLSADTAQYMRSMDVTELRTRKMTDAIGKTLTRTAALVATSSIAVSAVAIRQYGKFDEAMTKSTSIMGNLSQEMRDQMEETARSLAMEGVQSAEELAESYFFLASAGLDAKQSIAALPIVQQFATAGAFDMAKATDLLTDAQSALGLAVKDTTQNMINMTRVGDVLTMANVKANATVGQFSEALTNKAGAMLRLFNKDVEEGVAVLAAFADQGVKGTRGGMQLAIVIRELERAFRENSFAFRQHNVEVMNAEGKMNNLGKIVQDLETAFDGMSDQQRGATLSLMGFTSESMMAVAQLLGMSYQIQKNERDFRGAGGTMKDVADRQMKAFNNQVKIARSTVNEMALAIGKNLLPAIRLFIDTFKDANGQTKAFKDTTQLLSDLLVTGILVSADMLSSIFFAIEVTAKGATAGIALLNAALAESQVALDNWGRKFSWFTKAYNMMAKVYNFNLLLPDVPVINTSEEALAETAAAAVRLREEANAAVAALDKILDARAERETFVERYLKTVEGVNAGLAKAATLQAQLEYQNIFGDPQPVQFSSDHLRQNFQPAFGMDKGVTDQRFGLPDQLPQGFGNSFRSIHMPDLPTPKPELGSFNAGLLGQWGKGGDEFALQGTDFGKAEGTILEERLKDLDDHHTKALAKAKEFEIEQTQITEEYNRQRLEIEKQINQNRVDVLGTSIDGMLGALAYMGDEQSGIYKTMFAAQQALQVVQAIMNAHTAYTNAMAAFPPPYNIPIASTMLAMGYAQAGIIGAMAIKSFEGGGSTGTGPRAGGLDGKGGYMALVHPQERIIDDYKGGGGNVVVNNYSSARVEARQNDRGEVEVIIREVEQRMAGGIGRGGTPIAKAIEGVYKLRRGTK